VGVQIKIVASAKQERFGNGRPLDLLAVRDMALEDFRRIVIIYMHHDHGHQTRRDLAAKPGTSVVAGQDPEVTGRFTPVRPEGITDLSVLVAAIAGATGGAR